VAAEDGLDHGLAGERIAPPQTKAEYAHSELRRRILDGELPPGTRILLRSTAEELGLSIIPVREAIRMLENDGLVETASHRGATVTDIAPGVIIEAISIRMWLEVLAIQEATPHHTPATLEEARRLLAEADRTADRGDALRYSRANRTFHEALEAPAPALMRSLVAGVWDQLWEARRRMSLFILLPERIDVAQVEHRELLDAVARGDAEGAGEVMQRHRESTLAAWQSALADALAPDAA
jgi:DNA-binding GntR family transcriptional regulator